MERPTKKLWRKIGLQKNFLEGTSHSEESKNTLSQLQQSFFRSHCSNPNELQETEIFRTETNREKQKLQKAQDLMNVKKQNTYEQGSCETPINKLSMSGHDHRDLIWQVADDTIDLINQNKQSGGGFRGSAEQSIVFFDSSRVNEQKQRLLRINITQTVPYSVNTQRELSSVSNSLDREEKNLNGPTNCRKTSVDSMKIIFHGVQQKQSQTNESQYVRNIRKSYHNEQSLAEKIYTLQIEPKQLEKFHNMQKTFNRFKSISQPKLQELVGQFKKALSFEKAFIVEEMNLMRQNMTELISYQLSMQLQQLNDEIGYLYSQNEELMAKIQEKQSFIKKHHEEYSRLQQKSAQYTQSIHAQQQGKDLKIVQLQNQINKLQQKLQDYQDIQSKIQSQHTKIKLIQASNHELQTQKYQLESQNHEFSIKCQQLQTQLTVFINNERKLYQLMDQKTFDFSAAIIKNQELEWELNQLYSKNQQLEYSLRKEVAENIQKLQNQHFNRLNLEKSFLEKQKQKSRDHQNLISIFTQVLNESLKHISLSLIEAIHKQFNSQKNQYIEEIFDRAITEAQSLSRAYSYNKDIRHLNEQQSQLSPRSESQNGNSSGKNLRITGYFGSVTKPTLTIRLDDIQKKFSTQIPEDGNHADSFSHEQMQSVPKQKLRLFRGDTFSEISEEDSVQEHYAFRTIQPSYPRNQQRKWSLQKHSRHESEHMSNFQLNESITQDLQRVKLALKQENSQNNSRQYQKHKQNYQKSNPQQYVNPNVNYSFSEMNWNAFDSNDDRSSVTTYEKSENNWNRDQSRKIPKNTHSYYKAQTQRSDRSENSSSERQEIIEKIKERVKQKLRSKENYKHQITKIEPTYASHVQNSIKRHSYHQNEYEQTSKPIKKDDLILADFYQRHSIKNPVLNQHQTERRMSPIKAGRSPSNPRSRSPSSSSTSRITTVQNSRAAMTKFTPGITATYGAGNHIKIGSNIDSRNAFNKSMVQRPQFSAYSKRINQPTTTATYQSNTSGTYQPKSSLYSINRGETQNGSSYSKKY